MIELMVITSIMLLVTSFVLLNYTKMNEDFSLSRVAHEIASAVREAQVYGTSIREFNSVFPSSYGIHFDVAAPNSFIIFADVNLENNYYDGPSEDLKTFNIQASSKITRICVNSGANCGVTSIDILYKRPFLFTFITDGISTYSDVEIIIQSPKGAEKKVVVRQTGQISVE